MQFGTMVKKGQLQVTKKVNYLTLSSYNTTLMLHALCRIEENFAGNIKYDTNLAGYDDTLGTITIYVKDAHQLTKILTLIDSCEPIAGKLLSKDLDFNAIITNNSDQVENYEEIPPAEFTNSFMRGWRGLTVEDKKEFIKAFELLDKGIVSDLVSVKAGVSATMNALEAHPGNGQTGEEIVIEHQPAGLEQEEQNEAKKEGFHKGNSNKKRH
ncbi:MAG: hypothetical protein R3Y07_06460 [Eubacteriales bacterium]